MIPVRHKSEVVSDASEYLDDDDFEDIEGY